MAIENALASVAVKDIDSAVKWYERILKRPPSRPMAEVRNGALRVADGCRCISSPNGLVPARLPWLTDIAQQIAQLDNLDIDTSERTSSNRVRTVMITDPDGNHIAFAEPIDQRLAR